MPTKLELINAATGCAVRGDVSPTMHGDSILPLGQVLATDDSPATAAAYSAGRAALKSLYEGLGDIQSAILATESKFGSGEVGPSGRLGPGFAVDGAAIKQVLPDSVSAQLANDMATRFAKVARAVDANLKVVDETSASLSSAIDRALTPKSRDAMAATNAAQIRDFVAKLPDEKRAAWVLNAVEQDGDLEVAQAVLSTSGFVSGLDRQQAAFVREAASKKFAPREFAHLEAAKKLSAHLQKASELFVVKYKSLVPVLRESPHIAATKKLKEG